jgi:hypothetical protein
MKTLGKEIYVNKSYLEQWMAEHHFDVAMLAAATGAKTHVFQYLFNHSSRGIVHEPVFKAICTLPGFDWQKFARFPKQIDMEPEPLIEVNDAPEPKMPEPVPTMEITMSDWNRLLGLVGDIEDILAKKIGPAAATEEPDTKVL